MAEAFATDRTARGVGRGVLALCALVFVVNAAWIAQHCEKLRPIGRGDIAPSVPLPRIDGRGDLALADLRGKAVLVDFWATWCGPCELTVPAQKRLYAKYQAAGFEILSINEDRGADAARKAAAYAKAHQLLFPIVHDDDGLAEAMFRVESYPHMVIIDRRGVVRHVNIGVISLSKLEKDLDAAIRVALAP